MDPELRSQILQALAAAHQALPQGQSPTAAGDDDAIRQMVKGTENEGKIRGMADLIPSKDEYVTVGLNAGLYNAPGDFGRGVMSAPGNVAHAFAHPLDAAGGLQKNFFDAFFSPVQGANMAGQSVGARGGVPIRPAGGMITPETPGSITPAEQDQAMRNTAGGTLFGLGPLGAMAGGILMNPQHPAEAAGSGLGMYGTGAGVAKAAAPVVARMGRLGIGDPFQRAANEMNQTFLKASSEPPEASLAKFAPEGQTTANPMLGQANPVLANAFQDALKRNPELYGQYTDLLRKIKSGEVPDLATGLRQARDTWAKPLYDAMREQYPNINLEGTTEGGVSAGEAAQMGHPARPAYLEALRNGWKPNSNADIVPGTGTVTSGIGDILKRPVVQKALVRAQEEEGLGLAPEPGKPYSFQNVRDAIKFLGDKADAAFKTKAGNKTAGQAYRNAANELDAALQRQIPEYAQTQAEFARRSQLADQAEAEGGNLMQPKPPTHVPIKPPMSPFMSARYMATKPIVGSIFKGIDQRTASALAQILSAQGEDIPAMLQRVRQAGPPPSTPFVAPVAAKNRPGVFDITNMTPEQRTAYLQSLAARKGALLPMDQQVLDNYMKMVTNRAKANATRVPPGKVEGLIP